MKALATFGMALLLFGSALPLRSAASATTTLVGDVNGDCRVNIIDLALVASRYEIGVGSLLYSPQYDLNQDGVINILDIQIVAAHYNQHC